MKAIFIILSLFFSQMVLAQDCNWSELGKQELSRHRYSGLCSCHGYLHDGETVTMRIQERNMCTNEIRTSDFSYSDCDPCGESESPQPERNSFHCGWNELSREELSRYTYGGLCVCKGFMHTGDKVRVRVQERNSCDGEVKKSEFEFNDCDPC